MTRNNQSYWYGFEGIGTVRQLMGSQGQVVDAYAYDAWGNEITNPQSQVPNPFKYVGKHGYYWDTESALMLLGVRYYASGTGRFVSLDPIKHKMNWYTYVTDNPLSNIDPTGKNPWGLIVCTASCGLTLLGPIGGCIAGGLVNPADVICCALEAIKESGTSGVIGGVISVGCLACILWVLLRGPIKKYPEIPVCLIGALAGGFTGAMSSGDCSSVVCSAIAGCVFGTGGVVIKGKPEIVLEERAQLLLLPFVHVLEHLFTLICMVADILKTFVNVYSEDHGVFPVFETGALGTLFRLLGREV
jgi:RHS repeat-associated protein